MKECLDHDLLLVINFRSSTSNDKIIEIFFTNLNISYEESMSRAIFNNNRIFFNFSFVRVLI